VAGHRAVEGVVACLQLAAGGGLVAADHVGADQLLVVRALDDDVVADRRRVVELDRDLARGRAHLGLLECERAVGRRGDLDGPAATATAAATATGRGLLGGRLLRRRLGRRVVVIVVTAGDEAKCREREQREDQCESLHSVLRSWGGWGLYARSSGP
jgi:hypothetical protein